MTRLAAPQLGLTPRGKALLGLGLLLLACGLLGPERLLTQMALCLLFLLGICAWQARRNVASLSIRRIVPERLFCGEAFLFILEVGNDKSSPSFELCLVDELLDPKFTHGEDLALILEEVPALGRAAVKGVALLRNRGAYSGFKCRLSSSFPFGLCRCDSSLVIESPLIAYPEPALPPELDDLLANGQGDGDGRSWNSSPVEFKGLREFSAGDPIKWIHWPLSARHQRLIVREFEPAAPEKLSLVFHAYQGPEQAQPTRPELALRLLSGIFLQIHENGSEAEFFADFNQWEALPLKAGEDDLHEALENLAHAAVHPARKIDDLLATLEELHSDDRRVIVISNAPVKSWRHLLGDHQNFLCLDGRVSIAEAVRHIAERQMELARTRLEHAEELT